jgi:hypothetical protein
VIPDAIGDAYDHEFLSIALSAVAAHLEAKDARDAAAALTRALAETKEDYNLSCLARALSVVATRLETGEGARVAADAAATLKRALAKADKPRDLEYVAEGLAALAARLEAREARYATAEAAAKLIRAMTQTSDPAYQQFLAEGLSAVAAHLDTKEAGKAAAVLTQRLTETSNTQARHQLANGLSAVADGLKPEEAARVSAEAAAILIRVMAIANAPADRSLVQGLSAALDDGHHGKRAQAVAAAVGCPCEPQGLFGALAPLQAVAEPHQWRLSDQQMVELLKHPLCVGNARRIVLDQLGLHHGRTFADQWDFVRYAEEQKLGVDFTTPPKQPDGNNAVELRQGRSAERDQPAAVMLAQIPARSK